MQYETIVDRSTLSTTKASLIRRTFLRAFSQADSWKSIIAVETDRYTSDYLKNLVKIRSTRVPAWLCSGIERRE